MANKRLTIFQQVRDLEKWQAVAFSAAVLERMLPNYQLFCEVTEFTDPSQYRNTLNTVWEWLSVPKAKINFAAQLEKIEAAVPDPEDFDNFGVYPAIDTAMSMSAIILLIMDEDLQGAVVVSKLSQGTVEAYIDATAQSALSDEQSKQHPLMLWEVSVQQALLDLLAEGPTNAGTCKLLKEIAIGEGMSNIGIEVNP
jgi:uncharacterized protein YjaG (DUF416 family)